MRVPEVGPRDSLIRVRAASICGTDLHIFTWDRWAPRRLKPPLIFGHEFRGHVERVGAEGTLAKPSDFVSAEMHLACGHCFQGRTGQSHSCQEVRIIGIDADGCFAEFVRIPEANVWKIDPSIPVDYAAILDPLGDAVHTVPAGDVAGLSVAITGAGPIGLFSIAVAKDCGAGPIFVTELHPYRQKPAEKMGADYVLDPSATDAAAQVLAVTDGVSVDVVLEMSGHRTPCVRVFICCDAGAASRSWAFLPNRWKSISPTTSSSKAPWCRASMGGAYSTPGTRCRPC
jgi:threonine 3-dehydrogenase